MDKNLKNLTPLTASEETGAGKSLLELSEEDLGSVAGGRKCTMWVPPWGLGYHPSYEIEV